MHRGARRAPIFTQDHHCTLFLDLLDDAVTAFDIQVHAYSLMPNHFHLLVRSLHANLSRAMQRLLGEYTRRLNLRHPRWDGPVFRGRFHSQVVGDGENLPHVLAYIHLNPLKAGLITRLHSEAWTSHRAYIGREAPPAWLTTDYFLELFGSGKALHDYVLDLHRGKQEWPEQMEEASGWLPGKAEDAISGPSIREPRFIDAGEAMARVANITGSSRSEILTVVRGPAANPARRFAVWALKRSTELTHREIGEALGMSSVQVGHVLRRLSLAADPFAAWSDAWLAE